MSKNNISKQHLIQYYLNFEDKREGGGDHKENLPFFYYMKYLNNNEDQGLHLVALAYRT